jgi:hypothetical protein
MGVGPIGPNQIWALRILTLNGAKSGTNGYFIVTDDMYSGANPWDRAELAPPWRSNGMQTGSP